VPCRTGGGGLRASPERKLRGYVEGVSAQTKRENCAQMSNYGEMPWNLSVLVAADGSGLAHRVPRPLKEPAGALSPSRELCADDQVWTKLEDFKRFRWSPR
jgi:hypothetical protein